MISAALLIGALSGCAAEVEPDDPGRGGKIDSVFYTTSNGTEIECIYLRRGEGQTATGGPACWPRGK